MSIHANIQSRYLLFLAYVLFLVSLVMPTLAVDLGVNGSSVQPGYRVLMGGPFAAYAIIQEPGGQQVNLFLGIYYLITWLANFALVLPIFTYFSQSMRSTLAGFFALMAWSVLLSYLFITESLIHEIGIGYYLWSTSITLIFFFVRAGKTLPAQGNVIT